MKDSSNVHAVLLNKNPNDRQPNHGDLMQRRDAETLDDVVKRRADDARKN